MLIDREKAKISFQNTISSQDDWIYIIGKTGIGKTYFVKNITNNEKTIYCEPNRSLEYWKELLKELKTDISDVLLDLIKHNIIVLQNNKKFEQLSDQEKNIILETEINGEINSQKTIISKFFGEYLSKKYNYIVLDNLFKCDSRTYNWLISLLDTFTKDQDCHVIAICDNDKHWSSNELKADLFSRFSRIEINKYDNSQAYFDLINSVIHFDNSERLIDISEKLYNYFYGNAQSILSLINLLKNDTAINKLSDQEKEEIIIKKSVILSPTIIQNLNYIAKEMLVTLSISPIPLQLNALCFVLDCDFVNINNEIHYCLENNLIERKYNKKTNNTEYQLTNSFTIEAYTTQLNQKEINFLYEKIYRAYKTQLIYLNDAQALEIALKCESEGINNLAVECFKNISLSDNNISSKVSLLNIFLSMNDVEIPQCLLTMKYVDMLYKFGYYKNAYKVICNIKNDTIEFDYLMKKGDIEHLILHPNTANTFKKASELHGITTSQMLSAINRQIMALTQEKKKELQHARMYYKKIIQKYSSYECDGLIELYRNSNNVFSYTEALEYTIKGYNLSIKLNNNLERIKTLHNICMLKVLNGNYYLALNNEHLNIEPDFDMICKEFEERNEFLHELSYPLIDLGALEMFKFVKDTENNIDNLYSAKKYFSRAQIYAKSFYAKNITNSALLIVNSYIHKDDEEYIISARKRIFDNYSKSAENIKDFRVHRKILLTLATSSSITKHFDEGIEYLKLAKPHMFEDETLRYNNLCDDFNIPEEKIEYHPSNPNRIREYHTNSKFVPWLISFGH